MLQLEFSEDDKHALNHERSHHPHLNLIDQLWKFVKKHCLYSKYYADFTAFTHAIEDCLATTQTTHKQALSSLLTLNFQSFKKVQSLTV
jgi:hypothetical protein